MIVFYLQVNNSFLIWITRKLLYLRGKKQKNDTVDLQFGNFLNSYFSWTPNESKRLSSFQFIILLNYLLGFNLYYTRHSVFFLLLTLFSSATILLWTRWCDKYSEKKSNCELTLGEWIGDKSKGRTIKVSIISPWIEW